MFPSSSRLQDEVQLFRHGLFLPGFDPVQPAHQGSTRHPSRGYHRRVSSENMASCFRNATEGSFHPVCPLLDCISDQSCSGTLAPLLNMPFPSLASEMSTQLPSCGRKF